MTERKVYIGTLGPFYYDDAEVLGDPDGDFVGENYKGIITDGSLLATTAEVLTSPASADGVVRQADLDAYTPADGSLTLEKIEDITAARLLGRGSASTGTPQELTVDSNAFVISGTDLQNVPDTGWAVTNHTTDRVYDANSTTLNELADILGTLITVLITKKILGA